MTLTIATVPSPACWRAVPTVSWIGADHESARLLEAMQEEAFSAVVQKMPAELMPARERLRAAAALKRFHDESDDPVQRLKTLLTIAELGEPDLRGIKYALTRL